VEVIKYNVFIKLSKEQLQSDGSAKARELMEEGYSDASNLTVQARKVMEYLSAFIKELDSDTRAEVNDQDMDVYGAVLSLSSTGDRYDLEADTEYLRIKGELTERAKWLKIASKSKEEVVLNGAVVEAVPIKSASKEILKIKL